jgi:glyoxylase-like metal-dependent hydrolase (beta-lactamase superfamily II)
MPADTVELGPVVTRLLAPNPSMMTGPGTNTYLLGAGRIVVVDPGPAIPAHADRILDAAGGRISHILVTHTHPDHSPCAALLARATGAERIGLPAPDGPHQDRTFRPDRAVADREVLEFDGFALEVVTTPGHASNHACYRHTGLDWLFTGDHVVDGSTVVIDPPDGDMGDYLDSLGKVRALDCDVIAPGHGEPIRDPARVIDWIVAHRLEREAKVLAAIETHPNRTTHGLVPQVYRDVDPKLYGWAERSLLAHALKLEADGRVRQVAGRWRV